MAFNGSGTFDRPVASYVFDTVISETSINAEMDGIATGLSNCLTRDGQSVPTTNLPMGGYKHTGIADGSARTHYASIAQVQDNGTKYAAASGTDTYTASLSPAVTAYVTGQEFDIQFTNANLTTTPTLNVNSVAAKTIVRPDGTAVAAGDLNGAHKVRYDGTNLRVLNPRKVANTDVSGLGTASTQNTGTSGATIPLLNGANTFSGIETHSAAVNEAKGADIASATTTDIGAATGNYVNVTGTTTITGLGTIQAGTRRIVNFNGALTLTHNASSLILPGGANITTAAGDIGTFVSLGSGNWVCTNYTKASGTAVVSAAAGALTFLGAQTASASAALTFTSLISSTYNKYLLEFDDIILAASPTDLVVEVSTDNGSNWKTTGYLNNNVSLSSGGPTYTASTTNIMLAPVTTANSVPLSGEVTFSNPNSTGNVCWFGGRVNMFIGGSTQVPCMPAGYYNTTGAAITAIRLKAASGNITSGIARLYGLQKS